MIRGFPFRNRRSREKKGEIKKRQGEEEGTKGLYSFMMTLLNWRGLRGEKRKGEGRMEEET